MNRCNIFPTRAVYKTLYICTILVEYNVPPIINNYLNETAVILFPHFTSTIQLIMKPRPINNAYCKNKGPAARYQNFDDGHNNLCSFNFCQMILHWGTNSTVEPIDILKYFIHSNG